MDNKPLITTQNSEPAKLGERELQRLWLQIYADCFDMNETDLIITQIAQALKPKLGKDGDRFRLLHTSRTDEEYTNLFLDREVSLSTERGDDL